MGGSFQPQEPEGGGVGRRVPFERSYSLTKKSYAELVERLQGTEALLHCTAYDSLLQLNTATED